MNVPYFALPLTGYYKLFNYYKKQMKQKFGDSVYLMATSTYQFDDYSKYAMTLFNGAKRLERREKVFPKDCDKAFLLGKSFVKAN